MCKHLKNEIGVDCDYCKKSCGRGAYQYGEYRICENCMISHGFTHDELAALRRGNLKMPRINSIVKFDKKGWSQQELDAYRKTRLNIDEHFLFMGEVRQMPGHCIVVDKQGNTLWGYHTENFVEVEGDEI